MTVEITDSGTFIVEHESGEDRFERRAVPGPMAVGTDPDAYLGLQPFEGVAPTHAVVRVRGDGSVHLCCHHAWGVVAGGRRLSLGEDAIIPPDAGFSIGGYDIRWKPAATSGAARSSLEVALAAGDRAYERLLSRLQRAVADEVELKEGERVPPAARVEPIVARVLEREAPGFDGRAARAAALSRVLYLTEDGLLSGTFPTGSLGARQAERLRSALALTCTPKSVPDDLDRLRGPGVSTACRQLDDLGPGQITRLACEHLHSELIDLICHDGPLTPLLRHDIEELMVTRTDRVWVMHRGRHVRSVRRFIRDSHREHVCRRIAARAGDRFDAAHAFVNATLPDGNRVNIAGPPYARLGISVTIRKFPPRPFTYPELTSGEDALAWEAPTNFLRGLVLGYRNILIAGGTASGKTTLMNALVRLLPASRRLITIEDGISELRLRDDQHWVSMLTGRDVDERKLLEEALRERPQAIWFGECRNAAIYDWMMSTRLGHPGGGVTIHIDKIEALVGRILGMAAERGIEARAVREMIGGAIDYVIHVEKKPVGRRIAGITRVAGYDHDLDRVDLEPIYTWNEGTGRLEMYGHVPDDIESIATAAGCDVTEVLGWR